VGISRDEIIKEFALLSIADGDGGITSWLTERTPADIFERLGTIDEQPLTAVQLNQLLGLGHEAPVSDGYFRYYWLEAPPTHTYDVSSILGFQATWLGSPAISSLAHLRWGFYRLYVDALLYFGNIRTAFRSLRDLDYGQLCALFGRRRFDTEAIKRRGVSLPLKEIAKDNRYLISEMACKSYGSVPGSAGDLKKALMAAFKALGGKTATIRELLTYASTEADFQNRQQEFIFSADEVLDESVTSEADLEQQYESIAKKFGTSRDAALANTRYYLSMVGDLDVYVATSMRNRQDFRNMADICDRIFADSKLKDLNLRYFDPTLSAAEGHEDKGLIECLMVKCAKVLVYCAGDRESWGKDAEAAMALSLGKPVIFYCDLEQRSRFYKEVHPLSRLIEFATGVPVGAIVTDRIGDVAELLSRILENKMVYYLDQPKPGYFRLKDKLTESVVRLQTNDRLLAQTFWNHYHRDSRL
jgi:hypothetical protein